MGYNSVAMMQWCDYGDLFLVVCRFAHSFCDPKMIKEDAMDKLSKVMTLVVFRSYDELVAAAVSVFVLETILIQYNFTIFYISYIF